MNILVGFIRTQSTTDGEQFSVLMCLRKIKSRDEDKLMRNIDDLAIYINERGKPPLT